MEDQELAITVTQDVPSTSACLPFPRGDLGVLPWVWPEKSGQACTLVELPSCLW